MSIYDLTGENVFEYLLYHRGSFIVQYPEPRPNNAHKWFLVSGPKSKNSLSIEDDAGEYLVKNVYIIPELSDEEYKIQIALGSIDCRVYKLASTIKKKRSIMKHNEKLQEFLDKKFTIEVITKDNNNCINGVLSEVGDDYISITHAIEREVIEKLQITEGERKGQTEEQKVIEVIELETILYIKDIRALSRIIKKTRR